MGKARVSVENVGKGLEEIKVMVVAWEKQLVEGKEQETPLGESILTFPKGTKPGDMLDAIREAGEQIEEAANQAKEIRTELNELLSEEVKE